MASKEMAAFMTTAEAAEAVGLSTRTLWLWTRRLGITKYASQTDGRERLYAYEDVEKIRNRMTYVGKGLEVVSQ